MYQVQVAQFEGPLGLLLYLIRKEEMNIFDININEITRQYLDYTKQIREFDLETAGDFIAMAANLLHIKSKMLLPTYGEDGEIIETEDPRKELMRSLIEYQKYQTIGAELYKRELVGRDVFLRKPLSDDRVTVLGEDEIEIEGDAIFSMVVAYTKALRRAERAVHKVKAKTQSISSRVYEIRDQLVIGTRILFRNLLGQTPRRAQLLITFLSMLELGRMGIVSLFQSDTFGEIYVQPKKEIEEHMFEHMQEFQAEDAEAVAAQMQAKALAAQSIEVDTSAGDSALWNDEDDAVLSADMVATDAEIDAELIDVANNDLIEDLGEEPTDAEA